MFPSELKLRAYALAVSRVFSRRNFQQLHSNIPASYILPKTSCAGQGRTTGRALHVPVSLRINTDRPWSSQTYLRHQFFEWLQAFICDLWQILVILSSCQTATEPRRDFAGGGISTNFDFDPVIQYLKAEASLSCLPCCLCWQAMISRLQCPQEAVFFMAQCRPSRHENIFSLLWLWYDSASGVQPTFSLEVYFAVKTWENMLWNQLL